MRFVASIRGHQLYYKCSVIFIDFFLNLDGNYVCESVIIIHKSLSACEYCRKNFSAITVSSIGHFIRW